MNWKKSVLQAAGIYNVLWGTWVVLFPYSFFSWFELPPPAYPMIWQSVGMIVGVYGIGYYVASFDPMKHWPIIFVGWLGKVFGPVGAIWYIMQGKLTPIFFLHNITNDLIWIVPFTLILMQKWREMRPNKAEPAL